MAGVVLLAAVVLGVFWVFLGRGKGAWEHYLKEVEARGDSLDWKAYLPPPPPPDAENFAANSVLSAIGIKGRPMTNGKPALLDLPTKVVMGELGDSTKGVPANLVRAAGLLPGGNTGSLTRSEAAIQILAAIAPGESQVIELREASLRPGAKLPMSYPDPVTMDVPDFVSFRELAQLLTLRAIAEGELGRMDEAFADIRVVHRLADTVQQEPNLVSAMICVAINGLAPQAFWEGWVEGKWSDAQLATFQERFAKIDLLPVVDRAMRMERTQLNYVMNEFSGKKLADIFGVGGRSIRDRVMSLFLSFMPAGLFQSNLLYYNQLLDRTVFRGYDKEARRVYPTLVKAGSDELSRALSRPGLRNAIARMAIPNVSLALEATARHETFLRMASIACSLERFRRAKGAYPEHLGELVPEFAELLPHDLITGSRPVYRSTVDGRFLLYCPGWDEADDGGDSVKDWVWPVSRRDKQTGTGDSEAR